MPIKTWAKAWNDIVRNEIFKDEELKSLMCIPEGTKIIDFIDRYFIRAGFTNKLLKNEKVRIVYSDVEPSETDAPHVTRSKMNFDVYVKFDSMHNVGNDRLEYRTHLIGNRLEEILMNCGQKYGYKFWVAGDWDLGTRVVGYARYSISFSYMKVY